MYQVGELVIYGIHGVCRVAAEEVRTVDKKQVVYLALEPVGQGNARFLVPTHNQIAMSKLRPILSQLELVAMCTSDGVRRDVWVADENRRKQIYRELISSGDRCMIMQMVYSLYCYKKAQQEIGKKLHLCDENFLRDAEKLLCGEISIVMDLDMASARDYLRKKLTEDA